MMRSILQAPDDRLRLVAEPMPARQAEYNIHHKDAIKDLRATFAGTAGCIGLAATQIAHPWRVIVVDTTAARTDTYLMVNPVIVKASEDMQAVNDGCMSIDNGRRRGSTRRPKRITVEWVDPDTGDARRQKFTGLIAAAVHHEIDHLNGVLFTDKLAPTSTDSPRGAA